MCFQFNHPPPILPFLFGEVDEGGRNPRYKTEICRNFKERSRCVYGDQVDQPKCLSLA
jgi:hypothetical protein